MQYAIDHPRQVQSLILRRRFALAALAAATGRRALRWSLRDWAAGGLHKPSLAAGYPHR